MPKLSVLVSKRSDVPAEPGYRCLMHYHDELELLTVREGEFVIIASDGREMVAKEGEVIFINSGVPHRTRADIPARTDLIQFRESDFINSELTKIIKYSRKFNGLTDPQISIIKNDVLFEALCEIVNKADEKLPAYDIFVKSAIHKVLGCLYRLGILKGADELLASRDMQKIIPVLSHINMHYYEDISLKDASAMLSFDESYFCRLFKSATGATFTEYLNFVRICKAEKMLNKTRDSILEISEAVGFSSVSYFNRIFKKYRHLSPRAYRGMLYDNI